MTILCIFAAMGLFANALLHLLLLLGFPLGEYVLGGKYRRLPYRMRIISLVLFFLWNFIGLCYLNYGNIFTAPWTGKTTEAVLLFSTIFFFVVIFSNAFLTNSRKERLVMTPLCLFLFLISLVLLLN